MASANDSLMAKILVEEDRRQREALRVYRPQMYQEAFHRSLAHERVAIGGKRSGKSTAAACEFASQVLGIPIIGADGNPLPMKYPVADPKHPKTYWVIGWDIKHIGQTIYRLLFEPGMRGVFNVIRDQKTQMWRTFNGTDPLDLAREAESIVAEPLIPERLIDGGFEHGISWENKKANVFESVTLKNGATIYAFPSSARNPKQGEAVSGIWIDEDIQNPAHVEEWQDRLTDTDGWLIWSAWPHVKNFALVEMIDRANEEEDEPNPDIQKFQFIMSESNYIPSRAKKRSLKRMGDDDKIARRDRGELLLETTAMYDYSSNVHAIRPYEEGETTSPEPNAFELLRKVFTRDNSFPLDWTRYLAIDPSHTRTAVLFGVVPPPTYENVKLGDILIVERELVMRKSSPEPIAKAIKDIVGGMRYEAFIMDAQAGKQTHASTDRSTFVAYSDQFKKVGLRSRSTQHSFIPGLNKPVTRQGMVREMLAPRPDDSLSSVYFVESNCYLTRKEFLTYQKKVVTHNGIETILDEPANPRVHDCMAALEYLVGYVWELMRNGGAWVDPDVYNHQGSPAYQYAQKWIRDQQREERKDYVHLGPGAAA